MAKNAKNNSPVKSVDKRTRYYQFVQSVTQIVIAVAVFLGFIVSVFPIIEEGQSVLGVKLEFVAIFFFILILFVLIYWAHRRLMK